MVAVEDGYGRPWRWKRRDDGPPRVRSKGRIEVVVVGIEQGWHQPTLGRDVFRRGNGLWREGSSDPRPSVVDLVVIDRVVVVVQQRRHVAFRRGHPSYLSHPTAARNCPSPSRFPTSLTLQRDPLL